MRINFIYIYTYLLMNKSVRLMVIIFPLLVLLAACTVAKNSMRTLQDDILKELAAQKGTFAVGFKNLSTGDELFFNEHEFFHAASTIKTPVLIEVYRQAMEKKFSLDDSLVLKNEFKSIVDGSVYSLNPADDSETDLYKQIGEKQTIKELVYKMIIVSSNLATNLIIDLVDAKKVTQTMRELGAKNIQVLRGVEDSKAYGRGLNNTTTAYDLLLIFEKIAKEEAVSPSASQAMIHILLDQRFNDIIPAMLAPDVKIAHKTGSITGVQHD